MAVSLRLRVRNYHQKLYASTRSRQILWLRASPYSAWSLQKGMAVPDVAKLARDASTLQRPKGEELRWLWRPWRHSLRTLAFFPKLFGGHG